MSSAAVLNAVGLPRAHRKRGEYAQFGALAEDSRILFVVEGYVDTATNEVPSLAVEWVRGLWLVGKDRSSVQATTVQMTEVLKATVTIFLKENLPYSMVPDQVVEDGVHQFHSDQVSSTPVGRGKVRRTGGDHVGPPLILALVRIVYSFLHGPLGKILYVEPGQYSPDLSRLTLAALWMPSVARQRSVYYIPDAQANVEYVSEPNLSDIR